MAEGLRFTSSFKSFSHNTACLFVEQKYHSHYFADFSTITSRILLSRLLRQTFFSSFYISHLLEIQIWFSRLLFYIHALCAFT